MPSKDVPRDRFGAFLKQMRAMLDNTELDLQIGTVGTISAPQTRVELAQRWLTERRARERLFGEDANLFGEPVWDILLDLFVHRGNRVISVSSACGAAMVPATTALRWLSTLEERDLIKRTSHPNDRRTHLLTLTQKGVEIMNRVLDDGLARFRM